VQYLGTTASNQARDSAAPTASFFGSSNGAEPEVLVRGGAAQQESAEAGRGDGQAVVTTEYIMLGKKPNVP
jgi:hypothetical protein